MTFEITKRAEIFIVIEPTDAQAPAATPLVQAKVAATDPSRQRSPLGRSMERVHIAGMLCLLEPKGWFSLFMDDEFNLDAARELISARIAELGVDRDMVETYCRTPSTCTAAEGQAWGRQPHAVKMNRFRKG
jgi:hypothetical protein